MDGSPSAAAGAGQRIHECGTAPTDPQRGRRGHRRDCRSGVQAPAGEADAAGAHHAHRSAGQPCRGSDPWPAGGQPAAAAGTAAAFRRRIVLLKPLLAVVSNVFFGVLGSNLAEVHGRTLLRLLNPASTEALLVADESLTPATARSSTPPA